MKKYSKLEMEVIALNNEDVLTTSGGSISGGTIDPSKDPNKYCMNGQNVHNFGDWAACVAVCYPPGVWDKACDYYRGN